MSTNKFIGLVNGVKTLFTAIASSAGVGDASKILMTDTAGRLSVTFMPVGIGPTTSSAVAFEALAAGDNVNIFDVAGVANCRKADCTNGRSANGFVLSAFASSAAVTIYSSGINTARTGLTAGILYFLSTAGGVSTSAPSASGSIVQEIGVASTSTSLAFDYDAPTTIA